MALNPIAPVTDYQSMLNRICWFTSAATLAAIWLLRTHLQALDFALGRVDFQVNTGMDIPAGSLLPALFVGLITRIFRIHSFIGHWLGIRERFDIDVILSELARRVGIEVDDVTESEWLLHRHDLMRTTFYRFASKQSPQIDAHLIHQALDLWSWFWVGIETTCVFVLTSFTLIAAGAREAGLITFGMTLLLATVGLPVIRLQCKRAAIAQVRAILADLTREILVREAFSRLGRSNGRRQRAA